LKKDNEILLDKFLSKFSDVKLTEVLERELKKVKSCDILTIVCDEKVHSIPDEILDGTVYIMNEENLDTSSDEALKSDLNNIAAGLISVLKSENWKHVKIIFTGHAILGALAKYLVYRICHLESTDIVYFGSSGYREYKFLLREEL